jgi:hypothetical protein
MNVQQFEAICLASKYRPLEKQWTPHGAVLVAERHFAPGEDPEWPAPHWKTLWSIERDEMTEGQPLTQNDWYELDGVLRPLTRQDRLNAARLCAGQWIEDNRASGRYT